MRAKRYNNYNIQRGFLIDSLTISSVIREASNLRGGGRHLPGGKSNLSAREGGAKFF